MISEEIKELEKEGFTSLAISKHLGITTKKLSEIRRMESIKNRTYNLGHIKDKYDANEYFASYIIHPKTTLDLFCGRRRYWKQCYCNSVVLDNDKDPTITSDVTLDAKTLEEILVSSGSSFDLIDIDPFGDPRNFLELGIEMAKKGLIVTFGGLPRIKKYKNVNKNYFRQKYDIPMDCNEVTFDDITNKIIDLGKKQGKILVPEIIKTWRNCNRAYFRIL